MRCFVSYAPRYQRLVPISFTSRLLPRTNAENVVCIVGFRSSSLDSLSLSASFFVSLV